MADQQKEVAAKAASKIDVKAIMSKVKPQSKEQAIACAVGGVVSTGLGFVLGKVIKFGKKKEK